MSLPLTSPNTVLANALNQTVDLLRARIALKRPKRVDFIVGTQINGTPHLGTNLTQCAAFVLAREVRNAFSVDTHDFEGDFEDYLDSLVGLVMGMLEDPKHFFRAYSYLGSIDL
jgi:hypothetical protein